MADEFGHHHHHAATTGNWWDSSPRSRYESGTSSSSSAAINSLGWPPEMPDIKSRFSMDSVSVSGSSAVFHDTAQKLQGADPSGGGDSGLTDPNLPMMGLGLSSQAMDWNQALLRSERGEGGFRSMLQENLNSNGNFQQETRGMVSSQVQWRDKVFGGGAVSGDSSSVQEYKQINNRGFSLDQPHQFSSHGSSMDSTAAASFHMDTSAVYGSPSTLLQGLLLGSDQQQQQQQQSNSYNYQYNPANNYGMNTNELLPPASSWSSSKVPQFLRSSPPKQPPHSPLQFSNNAPFWNASAAAMNDVRSSFFPSLQTQLPTPTFDDHKPNKINISEARGETGGGGGAVVAKKSGSEAASKRPRNESSSPLPAFKVRKEKMGDRITALQQLVSPFGKTDTASVLSEAIEYIKFLHEQVNVLSTPYMKSGAPIQQQHQQSTDHNKSSKDPEGPKQDLRSRGLCLVPVSSTFPVAHETTVDFWTPTFGGTFR